MEFNSLMISVSVVQTLCSDYLSSTCLEVMLPKKKKKRGEKDEIQLFLTAVL